jgi:hypothetical protein
LINRIQVAEKVYTSYSFLVRDPGGHSSVPRAENAIYTLTEALARVGAHRFPVRIAEVTRAYFERSARFSSGQVAEDMRAVGAGTADAAVYERLSSNPFY